METINYYLTNHMNEVILVLILINIFFLILVTINFLSSKKWKRKYNHFMQGKEHLNLDDVLKENIDNINMLHELYKDVNTDIQTLRKSVELSFSKYAVIKYNAFEEMGGELSFVLALLNAHDSGILINGIHSREGCYIYLKNIDKGECQNTLSNEEKKALDSAKAMK